MFNKMATEPIPARVFALYKLVQDKGSIRRQDLKDLMEPTELNQGKTSYFNSVVIAAQELGLIKESDGFLSSLIDKKEIKTIADFRYYVIGKMEQLSDGDFYKVTGTILNCNEKILQLGKVSDTGVRSMLQSRIGTNFSAPELRGWRFWAQFMGFGYIQDIKFLPNAYVFVKNILPRCGWEKNESIPIGEFLDQIGSFYKELVKISPSGNCLNMSFSSALRELHDFGEIELHNNKDRQESRILYPLKDSSFFNAPVTDVIYREVKL